EVGCIVNRGGIALDDELPSEVQFAAFERLAGWWSALALFPGPVINRPTRFGYLPRLDLPAFGSVISELTCRSEWSDLSTGRKSVPRCSNDVRTNIHREDTESCLN